MKESLIKTLTRVEKRGDFYFKRDDDFEIYNAKGGKARSAYQIITNALHNGASSFTTAGSRFSPQCEIVSNLCEGLGLQAHLFMPNGKATSITDNIQLNKNSFIHRTKVGYNSVICSYAKKFASENDSFYIPFGMECVENIDITKHQVRNIPKEVNRIIVPCGSGMSMISIIKGLEYYKMFDKEVVGVVVGKNPKQNFAKFISQSLSDECNVKYTFVYSLLKYDERPKVTSFCGVDLDPIYESKCIPFLEKGDLLWVVGKRN
jgi:1-aminocyclopropane-1-carboxylate deaminase/D-cysteine desulfhydrase-like pyridoxal-dependent ACC family enzyme